MSFFENVSDKFFNPFCCRNREQRSSPENATVILRYFRSCGWITPKEIGRSGDNIASVSSYCRKLVDALHKIFDRDASGAITNHKS